jgi:8-oxo-dGTP diphosphatase
MNIIQTEHNLSFLPTPNYGRTILSEDLPPTDRTTAAFVFAFDGDRLLMTHLKDRGWDLPGGHIEPNETPEQTARRETFEETNVRLNQLTCFAHVHMHIDAPKPNDYKYPYPDSYMIFYWTHIDTLETFTENSEADDRKVFDPENARQLDFVSNNLALYYAAFEAAVDLTPKPEAPWRQKVTSLIIRRGNDNRYKLLVLQFDGYPDWPFRLPGGTVDENEIPEEAMYRELHEEAGLGRLQIIRKLGIHRYFKHHTHTNSERHDYLLLAPHNLPDQWTHTVTGQDADANEIFNYSWIGANEIDRMSDELKTFVTPEHIPELF